MNYLKIALGICIATSIISTYMTFRCYIDMQEWEELFRDGLKMTQQILGPIKKDLAELAAYGKELNKKLEDFLKKECNGNNSNTPEDTQI